jgi:hypothetical protein
MESKDILIKTIKDWLKLDNDVRKLEKEIKIRKDEKKTISTSLMDIMKKNEIDCFDIQNGQVCYNKKHIKKPITKKNLLSILTKYCNNDTLKANLINEFILDNREEIITENIVFKPTKTL